MNDLFEGFEAVSAKQWKQKIQYDLQGGDYNSLIWTSPEGIRIKPFYHSEDLKDIGSGIETGPLDWHLGQSIDMKTPSEARPRMTRALAGGAESLLLKIPSDAIPPDDFLVYEDPHPKSIHLDMQFLSEDYVGRVVESEKNPSFQLHLNLDPIGYLVRSGNWFQSRTKDFETLETLLKGHAGYENLTILRVDASIYQNAGANRVQQLAYSLAHANEYLNSFVNAGKISDIGSVVFQLAIGGDYFFEIAKLCALRQLWGILAKAYGLSTDCHILALPSRRNKTIYDYNVNMLRTTTECMAAILGGADTVCNLRYDSVYHGENSFAEHLARNQLLILRHEGGFSEIDNPVRGCYFLEKLTSQLASQALALFKDIEKAGGFLRQLAEGTIQRKIRESARKEQEAFDQGRLVLIGTNRFQNPEDRMQDQVDRRSLPQNKSRKTLQEPLIESRVSESLETERLKNEH